MLSSDRSVFLLYSFDAFHIFIKFMFLIFTFFIFMASPSYAKSGYCTNCSEKWTQALDRVTNVQQLATAMDHYAEGVRQTTQQIRMVQQNLEQYQNMLQNTKNLSPSLLSSIAGDFRRLGELQRQLKLQRGDLESMQRVYQDMYPGYDGMSGQTNGQYEQRWKQWSAASDQAYQATFQATGRQLQELQGDAGQFDQQVQQLLNTPEGRMEALQAANQLAALQLRESREMRSVMNTYIQAQIQAASKAEQMEQSQKEADMRWMKMDNIKDAPKVKGLNDPT